MPRNPQDDFEIDPGRNPGEAHEDEDRDDAALEPDRSVARHTDEADEAEEAELAEEDILEIAEIEDEHEVLKGDGPDA